ncbi:MAG: hypothetical protein MUO72_13025 [Bacteroidales bacterium]|nr:hypothetical protein [Bacteroidales bacterium]
MIKAKNDLRIDAGVSVFPLAHATISYGLTNKFALQAFGSFGATDRYYFHLAPGLYRDFGNNRVMEMYGGFGYGHGNAHEINYSDDIWDDNNPPSRLYGNYQVYFLQFNLGKYEQTSKHLDYGFGIKTGYFHSNLTDINYYTYSSENGPFPTYRESSLLIEPILFFRTGGERVKFSFKVGLSRVLTLSNPDNYVPTPIINLGLGINFTPNTK